MGKEWLHWVGGRGGGGGGIGRSSTRRGRTSGETKEGTTTSAGCMCSVFQLFDLHHFQLPLNQQQPPDFHPENPSLQEEATTSKRAEAPRNSLELDKEAAAMNAASSIPSAMKKEEEILNFPVGIQIKTAPRISTSSKSRTLDDFSSDCSSSSPGTKTPNLVARLMGLDLLPECNSPSISSKPQIKFHCHRSRKDRNIVQSKLGRSNFLDDNIGTRSLPETPRISSARRSDVEYHRLSLQMNKENISEEFPVVARRGRSIRLQPQDENRSPGNYAKQIVRHFRENEGRRVGLDVTNTNRNREHTRRDENLILLKPAKKNSKFDAEIFSSDGKQIITSSSSPRLRFLDANKNKSPRVLLSSDNHRTQGIINPLKPKPHLTIPFQEHNQHHQQQQVKDSKKVGRITRKCSSSRLKNKKEEPFVHATATNTVSLADKKFKRTPLSSDIVNISAPILLQVKKDPSPPPTKLPQKQPQVSGALSSKRGAQLSSNSSHSYKQLQLKPDKIFAVPENVPPDSTNGCATALPGGSAAEYGNYIQRILKCAGAVTKITPLTLAKWKWHTLSHPIEPSIFYQLELFHSRGGGGGKIILSHRCNRRLIFELVDEILAEILKPHVKRWILPITADDHFPLVDKLCKRIDSFPAANCQVLEDIDSLIDKDLCKSQLDGLFEEGESIVCEIEGEIVEWLVGETVMLVGARTAVGQTATDRCHVGGFHVM